ncbi:MAG: FliA/WhiG family RNA polymerase sigma factor [Planctomycetota bacterium]
MAYRANTIDQDTLQELWVEMKDSGSDEVRNRLMEHYLPMVKYLAERIHSKLPSEVQVEDLYSAGVFGLMDAINNFDLSRGVKFETYCSARIRGAILDELRAMDWVPRLVRSRAHMVEDAYRKLQAKLNRFPSDAELAEFMGLSMKEYYELIRSASAVSMVSLNRDWDDDSKKNLREIDVVEDKAVEDPSCDMHRSDLKDLITRGLSEKERLILILYYYEEMTMKEIGAALDLSESRVSQMHSSILLRLQEQLSRRRGEFAV